MLLVYQGRMQDFSRGGAQLKKILEVGYTCRKAACREQRSSEPLLGGFGGMLPKKIFKNGAISCVLRAIFNHFHDKIFSQKFMNKQEFFHRPFYSAAPPLIYLNIDIMDT